MKENAASAEAEAGGAADRTAASPTAPSRGEVVRSMRAFATHQGLWGAWSQFAGLSTAVLTGYALWLGADAAAVALLSSIISVMALAQLAAPLIGARFGDEKRFILKSRMGAMLLRGSILAIPFAVPEGYRFALLVVLLSASLLLVQLSSPYIGSWQSNIIPRAIRARFTSRATIVATVAGSAVAMATVTSFIRRPKRGPSALKLGLTVAAVRPPTSAASRTCLTFNSSRSCPPMVARSL